MFVNSDFSDLLRLFNANQVKYLLGLQCNRRDDHRYEV
jgi:hypothetical protein